MIALEVDFIKWVCFDCRWEGSRHETDSNFRYGVLCPKCGSHRMEGQKDQPFARKEGMIVQLQPFGIDVMAKKEGKDGPQI